MVRQRAANKKMLPTLKAFTSITDSDTFLRRHRRDEKSFTRHRKLPFNSVLTILLRKSVKSLQRVLIEWCRHADEFISASALSQARQKFRYTAFIELLEECVVKPMYNDRGHKRYKGHRLLAIDGSTLRLPTSKELIDAFGTVRYMNGRQAVGVDTVESKASVLYDVLNEIPLAGSIHPGRTNDIVAAQQHLENLGEGDILMADRGFISYAFFAQILAQNAHFIIRVRDNTYERYHHLLSNSTQNDVIVDIERSTYFSNDTELPGSLRIRFVKIILGDGEVEILATSLLDRKRYPFKDFKKLYYKRWRIETFFQVIKSRLAVDNFTGRTVEAIKQDFFSTLFVSGLETILSAEVNAELAAKNTRHQQQVNKAISFHAIKDSIILLMFDPPPDFAERVRQLFIISPTLHRPERIKEKERLSLKSNARSLHFQKFARKVVF
jgi:IS4 transposase